MQLHLVGRRRVQLLRQRHLAVKHRGVLRARVVGLMKIGDWKTLGQGQSEVGAIHLNSLCCSAASGSEEQLKAEPSKAASSSQADCCCQH